ncbi:TPA: hypothetical protein I9Y90_000058 [Elizabethkingia anophelis]|nr:hypothetical protein [Elizabethkingia anophelis]HAT4009581.1 hypothetical protein [Elizabethkingia anophelis]
MATLKKLMTLFSQKGMLDQRSDIIHSFTNGRTTSAKALTASEIDALCRAIEQRNTSSMDMMDKKRKRLMAAIFGMLKKMNKKASRQDVIKIACRAAKVYDFNKIPPARLDSLYNAFINAQKDLDFSKQIIEGYINEQISYN